MKGIITLAATALFASNVMAADGMTQTNQHEAHHQNAKQMTQHDEQHSTQSMAAHKHDHQNNMEQANKHAKDHNGSHEAAHLHDHNGQANSAQAHANDHAS